MLSVKNLTIEFDDKRVVDDISFTVYDGEILGIVGESGSGKTMSMLAVAGLLPYAADVSGEIYIDDTEINHLPAKLRRKYNGDEISMIFQEPMTSLNPTMKVGKQIEEMLKIHCKNRLSRKDKKEAVYTILKDVNFENPKEIYNMYPHNLSGGMRQRIMIAMALILNPSLMIADEPTTALDSENEKEILNLIMKLNEEKRVSIVFVSHNLELIHKISDRVLVMYEGKIVESGDTDEVFRDPKDEYTKKLLDAIVKEPKTEILGSDENIIEVENLSLYYKKNRERKYIKTDINFAIKKGEILGIQGRSGCGKTTLAKTLLGFHKGYEGEITNNSVMPQMVFQDPFGSLNPVRTIRQIVAEPLVVQGKYSKEEIEEKVIKVLTDVGLKEKHLNRYPSELSGGQRQRVSIAVALIGGSNFIIADEPVSALDVTIQKQILSLLLKLQKEYGLSILFISHDEDVMKQMCDRIIVW